MELLDLEEISETLKEIKHRCIVRGSKKNPKYPKFQKNVYSKENEDYKFLRKYFNFLMRIPGIFLASSPLKVTVQSTGGFVSFWPKAYRFSKLF
jgi:hypothetical protein